jgi:putative ABC transport system permease protein
LAGSGVVRQALVVMQFAVLVLLMIVIVTVSRQTRLAVAHAWPAGSQQVLLVSGQPICVNAFEERVRTLPGVATTACASKGILRNLGFTSMARTTDGQAIPVALGSVEAGFFELYGLHPLAGRTFQADRPGDQPLVRNPDDDDHGPPVVLNATAARRLGFASPQAAVDRVIHWDRFRAPFTQGVGWTTKMLHDQSSQVLGVVPDYQGLSRETVKPVIYWVDPGLMELLSIKVSTPATPGVLRALDSLWRSSGHFSATPSRPIDAAVREAYADVLTLGEVVAVCAGLAMALACTGLFALASYTTEQRTKEFGIRKAMGATAVDIARLLLWQFSKPVLAAILIAAPLGYLLMRAWLRGFGDRVALTPLSFIAIAAVAVLIAWATVLAHTWRVARTRPVAALRYE